MSRHCGTTSALFAGLAFTVKFLLNRAYLLKMAARSARRRARAASAVFLLRFSERILTISLLTPT
jgi:hypothetical protein